MTGADQRSGTSPPQVVRRFDVVLRTTGRSGDSVSQVDQGFQPSASNLDVEQLAGCAIRFASIPGDALRRNRRRRRPYQQVMDRDVIAHADVDGEVRVVVAQ